MNQRFGKDVGQHIVGSTVVENNRSFVVGLTNVVVAGCNVLG